MFDTLAQVIPRAAENRIAARGSIQDHTSGADWVAVQVFIQRSDPGGWVTVVTGPRHTGNDYATTYIPLRSCTNGRTYRAYVNYNYRNEIRDHEISPSVKC